MLKNVALGVELFGTAVKLTGMLQGSIFVKELMSKTGRMSATPGCGRYTGRTGACLA